MAANFAAENKEADTFTFSVCPKCEKAHPKLIRGGISRGKQLYRCKNCNKRFVTNHGQLRFYSHQPQDKWNEVIADTIEGNVSIEKTAAKIDVNPVTAFRMRHKLLHALGISQEDVNLNGIEELDEKYFGISHKGMRSQVIPGKKRGSNAGKRGLSKEQICIMTGGERNGRSNSYARAYSMGKVNEDDAMKLGKHIDDNSSCLTDAAVEYRKMIESRNGKWHIAKLGECDNVYHLNHVNNFHGMMEDVYNHYRGVSSKYINRYAALFCVMRECRGMDRTEIVIHVLKKLRKKCDCFFIRQISTDDVFAPAIEQLSFMEKEALAKC